MTQELAITRVFDAPRELVYRAFTDPDQLAAWFGPEGWSVPRETIAIEARVGGRFDFTMVDDADPAAVSPVSATFTEVVENELLVGTEEAVIPGIEGPVRFTLRLEFHDEDGRTRLELRQGPYTPELAGGARVGWEGSFGKLDRLLAA